MRLIPPIVWHKNVNFIEFDKNNFDPNHGKKLNLFDINDYMMRKKTNILVKVSK